MNTAQLLIFPGGEMMEEKHRLILDGNNERLSDSTSSTSFLRPSKQVAIKLELVEGALDATQFILGDGSWFTFRRQAGDGVDGECSRNEISGEYLYIPVKLFRGLQPHLTSMDWRDGGLEMQNDHAESLERFHDMERADRKSTRLNSSHVAISYAVFCLKKKKNITTSNKL